VAFHPDLECFSRSSRKRPVFYFLFLPVVLLWGSFAFAQQNVGFVLEIRGTWTAGAPALPLKLGQLLPAESVLANTTPADNDRIVVANMHGDLLKTIRCKDGVCRECTDSGACYDPIHPLPKAGDSAGTVSTLFNAVLELFMEKPERYSVHRVRGSDLEASKNAVIRLQANTIELTPFLEGKENGRYDVRLTFISDRATTHAASSSVQEEMNWSANGKAVLPMPGITPGLYEVRLSHGTSTNISWILLSSGSDYDHLEESFEKFQRQTDRWGKNVSPATAQAYQRAYLEYLDLHGPGSNQ